MNAAKYRHSKIHFKVAAHLAKYFSSYDWLVDFDFHGVSEDGAFLIRPDLCAVESGRVVVAVEISDSTRTHDLSQKKEVYRLAGVDHYLVFDCDASKVYEFELKNGIYAPSHAFHGIDAVFTS